MRVRYVGVRNFVQTWSSSPGSQDEMVGSENRLSGGAKLV